MKHDREPPSVFRVARGERAHVGKINGAAVNNAVVEIGQNRDRCRRRRDAVRFVGGVEGGEQVGDELRPLAASGFRKDLRLAFNAARRGVSVADQQARAGSR